MREQIKPSSLLEAPQATRPRAWEVVVPVLLAALATGFLFLSVDRQEGWSVVSALLGMALLGAVLCRQVGRIMELEHQVLLRARQLTVVSEVVSALNASSNIGGALGTAFDRLTSALGAEGGAVWLPAPEDPSRMLLVEHRGLSVPDGAAELLADVERVLQPGRGQVSRHKFAIDRQQPEKQAFCLSARLGGEEEHYGYISILGGSRDFDATDAAILAAVGSDVANALRNVRLLSEARRLADRDPLTGLHNHRSGHQKLQSELERCRRGDKPLAVMMMDLDNFKLFNDTYGHPAGDEIIRRVGAIIKRTCRDSDTVARYGGDEFMVVLPETNLQQATRAAERLQAALARERFQCQDSQRLPIGFSYGIAAYPDDAQEAPRLVALADAHLLTSKASGGNRITAGGATRVEDTLSLLSGTDLFGAMVIAIDNKDNYTRKHSEDVTAYALELARATGMPEDRLQTLQVSGLLHDVGKIGVPDSVLRKPGSLSEEEMAAMRRHAEFGAMLLGSVPGMEQVVLGVRSHHERWDGRGYPDGLAGENIPEYGRILAVADAFSAMTTSRPYRKGLSETEALEEIQQGLGTQFDPVLGELFLRLRRKPARVGRTPRSRRLQPSGA